MDWKTFSLILVIGSTILGVLWNAVEKAREDISNVKDDIFQVKLDVAEVKGDLNNLIRRIDGGELTFKRNENH